MNWLDLLLLAILAASVIGGVVKGFARLMIGLIAAVAGFFLALWFHGVAGGWLLPYVSYPGLANFIGFVLIVVAALVLGALTGALLSRLLKWVGLSWVDRVLGGLFGLARGLVFAVALVLALMAFARHPPPHAVVESRLAPYVTGAASVCAQIAPHEVREAVEESYAKAREIWDEMLHNARKAGRRRGSAVLR